PEDLRLDDAAWRARRRGGAAEADLRGCVRNRMRRLALFLAAALALSAQSRRPVVAVGGILHETNTFNPAKTNLADFEIGLAEGQGIVHGPQLIRDQEGGSTIVSGYIEGARRYGLELYPTMVAGP